MATLRVCLVTLTLIGGALSTFERTECGQQRVGFNSQSGAFIVGGTEAEPGEYPWQAALYRYDRRICGATVVHPEWIVTAAHCVDVINDPPIFDYMVGSTTLSNYSESQYHQVRETTEVHVHPNYRLDSNNYDIALMRMSEPFEWDEERYVYPACVPSADMVDKFLPGSDSVITGWGAEREGGAQSDDLNEVTAPITSQTYCNESYGGSITDYMICAGIPEGGIDSCQGDSGGPMVAKNEDDGLFYLIGVVSWGSGCARPELPGVYARVTSFADWIEPIFNGQSPDGMPVGECSADDFQCSGGFCVDKELRCNGRNDCYHDTDELYCDSALKPFDVYFDKMIDTDKSDIYNDTFPSSNDCGLTCLNSDCHAFDALPKDEMNQTVCIFALNKDFKIINLTPEESQDLGITHFQRGASPAPGSVLTSALGTIMTPAFTAGEHDDIDPGLLQYTMSINGEYYNHMSFNFIAIKPEVTTAASYCDVHATQNLVVMRGAQSGEAIVKCLDEIVLDTDYEVNEEDAVLEFYSATPQTHGFIVDYRASWYCDSVDTMAPGILVSPRYGIGEYPSNVMCRSLVRALEGQRVRLEVEFFQIEFDGETGLCARNYDTLMIYDGPDDSAALIGRYCGDMIPPELTSTSSSLYVVFKSDSSAQEAGYKLNFFFTSDMTPTPETSSTERMEPPVSDSSEKTELEKQIDDLDQELRAYKGGLSAVVILCGIVIGVLIAAVCTLNRAKATSQKIGASEADKLPNVENMSDGIHDGQNGGPTTMVNEAYDMDPDESLRQDQEE